MASEQVQVTAQVADGFEDLFYPIVKECDEHVRSVVASQELLAVQIDRLGNELQKFAGVTQIPSLDGHVAKLGSTRRRVGAMHVRLQGILERLDRIAAALGTSFVPENTDVKGQSVIDGAMSRFQKSEGEAGGADADADADAAEAEKKEETDA